MTCRDVGQANADIAGIGIIIAFAFQAIASWVLSAILEVFLPDLLDHQTLHDAHAVRRGLFTLTSLREEARRIERDFSHLTQQVEEQARHFAQLATSLTALREQIREFLRDVDVPDAPHQIPYAESQQNVHEPSPRQEARSIVAEILYFSSDVQTLAGIALALIGIIRKNSLNLYQFHLIYDTINLTSVSNCAALASASVVDTSDLLSRLVLMTVFSVLYLIFTIIFGVRLSSWDDKVSGRCYNTSHLALLNAAHPSVDTIYLGVTCLYMFGVLGLALLLAIARCDVESRNDLVRHTIRACQFYAGVLDRSRKRRYLPNWADQDGLQSKIWYIFHIPPVLAAANPVLQVAMLQLPLHLYFIIRIRLSNEPLLSNGSDENQWGFGQIYALILSAGLVIECCKGYLRYRDAKIRFTQHREHPLTPEEAN